MVHPSWDFPMELNHPACDKGVPTFSELETHYHPLSSIYYPSLTINIIHYHPLLIIINHILTISLLHEVYKAANISVGLHLSAKSATPTTETSYSPTIRSPLLLRYYRTINPCKSYIASWSHCKAMYYNPTLFP